MFYKCSLICIQSRVRVWPLTEDNKNKGLTIQKINVNMDRKLKIGYVNLIKNIDVHFNKLRKK